MDPKKILADPKNLKRIDRLCAKKFRIKDENVWCSTCVIDGLLENDGAKIRAFRGESAESTYLCTVISSQVFDCLRQRYGRKRAPVAAEKIGPWAVSAWELVCLEKFTWDDAYDILAGRGDFTGTRTEYETSVEPVREKGCPETVRMKSADADGERKGNPTPKKAQVDDPLESMMKRLDPARRIQACRVIRTVIADLSPEDRLLIRLLFRANRNNAQTGRILGITGQAVGKRKKRILKIFQKKLLAEGIR